MNKIIKKTVSLFLSILTVICMFVLTNVSDTTKIFADTYQGESLPVSINDLVEQAQNDSENYYFIIFYEGFRDGRLEMSSFDSSEDFDVVWDTGIDVTNYEGDIEQYFYNDEGKFELFNFYDRITDDTSEIIASNVDIHDDDGNILFKANVSNAKIARFTLGNDNNNYVHSNSTNYSNAGFKGVKNYVLNKDYFDKLTVASSKSEKNKIKRLMHRKWNGACYGIAMSMGLLYEKYIDVGDLANDDNNYYYSMPYPCNNDKLLNMINYYNLSQNLKNGGIKSSSVSIAYNKDCFSNIMNLNRNYDSLSVCLKKLVDYTTKDHVNLLGFTLLDGSGHAVLVSGCTYDSDNEQYRLKIYDENSVNFLKPKGKFSYMTVEKDYSGFSYTDANGDIYDNDSYASIFFLDWNKLGNILPTAKYSLSNHAEIDFLLGNDFRVSNSEGKYIEYKNSKFAGNMNIYDISTTNNDDGTHIIIETDNTDYVTLTNLGSSVDFEFYDNDNYLALQSKNLDSAKLTLNNGIELKGSSYTFASYVGMNEVNNNENDLLSVSAKASSNTSISKENNKLKVKANKTLTNIKTTDYVGIKMDEKKHASTEEFNVASSISDNKLSSSIKLKDKSVTFSGKKYSIDRAIVKGSSGKVVYRYYTDRNCTKLISNSPVNAGTYYVKATVKEDNNYKSATSNVAKLTINKAKIVNAKLSSNKFVYNGKSHKPSVIVKDARGNKIKSSNYKVTYAKTCMNVGKYNVKIKLRGNFTGQIDKSFTIVPKATSIRKTLSKPKGFYISWKKQTAMVTGYEIQYSLNSKFNSPKTLTIKSNKLVKRTVTKLKGNMRYYIRVRTYKIYNGKKYYSFWSNTKSLVTK